jgi:hypothetical protein
MELIHAFLTHLPPIRRCNANAAAAWGFVFGAVGLALYLRSFIDHVVTLLLAMVLMSATGDIGWMAGALFASVWGYLRVTSSNRVRDVAEAAVRS